MTSEKVAEAAQVDISNNREQNRYEIRQDDELVGIADYMLNDGLITFTHTEVFPEFEGRGLASRLVRHAMDEVRDDGDRKVLALCPYVKHWLQKHPDYLDLAVNAAR
ncbi:MAG: GNAT family N-acetyltransferase [Brooklawnia sp.]|uniref:GNAT family N-acetyltransferase n=1 Tax=Brooklawnia sp. TaxID=2699740 RepID=UPI003C73677E